MLIIFMGYRVRKQLMIVLIVIIILALIGAGVYLAFFRQAPTCFDGIQNHNEEGVDCGGPCTFSCERLTIKDIQVSWVKFFPLNSGKYDLAAYLINPNPNFGLSKLNYTFRLFGSAGELIKEQFGESFILPNQKKYLIEGGVNISEKVAKAELFLSSVPKEEWKKINENYSLPALYVYNKQFGFLENPPGAFEVSGLIKNDSAFNFENIVVSVILLDGDRRIVGVNKTEARTILAGEDRYFLTFWPASIGEELLESLESEIQVETNLLSDDNFMRKYGVPEKFQEY
ncbi:hypothetical protein KJ853_02240 [Patescibacteria group bacterium]|nr:hypothetical protein [Patescibacteria group bacterium]